MPTDMGWVKAHRKLLNNPVVCKDSDHMAVWFFLLLSAAHNEQTVVFGGSKITLLPGQLLTSRNVVAKALKIDPSKVYRILKRYEIEQQIEQRTDRQQSLVTIRNWGFYQNDFEQRNEQQVNNDCTTKQENKDEKEKRSKKEKEENKEIYKNARSVCNAGAHTHENTHTELVTLGKYENVTVPSAWLSDFKSKYTYADEVIESLSRYKATKNIGAQNDLPFLESFAESDKEKYGNRFSRKNSAMWKDESKTDEYWDNFFQIALKRSEEEMMGRKNN